MTSPPATREPQGAEPVAARRGRQGRQSRLGRLSRIGRLVLAGRRWIGAAVVAVVLVLAAVIGHAQYGQSPAPALKILVSSGADRSTPVGLDGSILTGPSYVFVTSTSDTVKVTYCLDVPAGDAGCSVRLRAPFDLAGDAVDEVPQPLDPSLLSPGTHRLVVQATRRDGTALNATVSFSVTTTAVATLGPATATTGPSASPSTRPSSGNSSDGATARSYTVPSDALRLRDYGAACDGRTDDHVALQKAVEAGLRRGGATIAVPAGRCRIVQTAAAVSIELTGRITFAGTSRASALLLDTDQPGAYRELFRVAGNDVSFRNLRLERVGDASGLMISLQRSARFGLDNVVLDGNRSRYPSMFHGIALQAQPGETVSDVTLRQVTIEGTDYGLFQDNANASTVRGITVSGSTFTGNYSDDLEFNAPAGVMTDIAVSGSRFSDNRAVVADGTSGFGVGLANVQRASIRNNTFTGYRYEPVHIENGSSDVTVSGNRFSRSFTASLNWASHVFIISGSHDITVSGNVFDTAANSNRIDCVYAGPGGNYAKPYRITLRNNTFRLRKTAKTLGNYGATQVTSSAATVTKLR